jgi:hypothetical protein
MQFAQLLGRDFRRRAHRQILGTLVHREQHDLAQILLAEQQRDDAVDARRDAAVRRRAERELNFCSISLSSEPAMAKALCLSRLLFDYHPVAGLEFLANKVVNVPDSLFRNIVVASNDKAIMPGFLPAERTHRSVLVPIRSEDASQSLTTKLIKA